MKSYNVLGVEIKNGKNQRCLINIKIEEGIIYVTKGMREYAFSKKEIEKIFKEGTNEA